MNFNSINPAVSSRMAAAGPTPPRLRTRMSVLRLPVIILVLAITGLLPLTYARAAVTTQTRPLQRNDIGSLETATLCPDGAHIVTAGATGVYVWTHAGDSILHLPPGASPAHGIDLT